MRISEHFVAVDDHCEPLADSVADSEPHAPRGIEAHDLNANPGTEIPEELLRQGMRAVRILSDESGGFPPFLSFERLHGLSRERLGTRGSARFQDSREEAKQLDSGRPGRQRRSITVPR